MNPVVLQALVFDLDDTLHPEADFTAAGFRVVAAELERRGAGPAADLERRLGELQAIGERTRIFQVLAAETGFPTGWIPGLVERYRSHQPVLSLAPGVAAALTAWRRRWPIGCVTDGRPETQYRKVRALGLGAFLDAIVFTDALGPSWRKPDPRPFHLACTLLGSEPARTLFVGDHPDRDIRGAGEAGLQPVRLRIPGGFLSTEAGAGKPLAEFTTWSGLAAWLDSGTGVTP